MFARPLRACMSTGFRFVELEPPRQGFRSPFRARAERQEHGFASAACCFSGTPELVECTLVATRALGPLVATRSDLGLRSG